MQNTIPKSIPVLVPAAKQAAYGAGLYGAALPLLQNTQANINADIDALTDSIMAYGLSKTELSNRRDTVNAKVDNSRMFLTLSRDNIKPYLGSEYNQSWDITGLVGSLSIPYPATEVAQLLLSFKGVFTANPAWEIESKDITAARAQELLTDLEAAFNGVNNQLTIVGNLLETRDQKAQKLRKRLAELVMELGMRMDGLDNRWLSFGFNKPDADETPEAPLNVSAVLVGPTAVAVKWNASARAEYYRVFKKVHNVDNDYVAAGSPADLDFTLENLPAATVIEIVITAVNNGGESAVSEKVTITTTSSEQTACLNEGPHVKGGGAPCPAALLQQNHDNRR